MQKSKSISKEIPLSEITLRKYERPQNLSQRELSRKVCLSLGLLQPGDSRDVVVDLLNVLIFAKKESKAHTSQELCSIVAANRKITGLSALGVAPSNIRRQLKRLKDLSLVEKRLNAYRISEHEKLEHIFDEKIEKIMVNAISSRIKEYLKKLDEM